MVRRKRFRKKGRGLSRQVFKNKRKIRMITNLVERKFLKQRLVSADINTTSNLLQITNLIHGTGDGQRIGDKVMAKSIMIRGFISNNHGTAVDGQIRLIVFMNKRQNGITQILTGEILDDLNIVSLRNWAHASQYIVLYDQTIAVDTTQHSLIPFKIRLSKLNKKVIYEGTGAGQADAMANQYYFAWYGTVAGTTDNPQLTADVRLTYDDA